MVVGNPTTTLSWLSSIAMLGPRKLLKKVMSYELRGVHVISDANLHLFVKTLAITDLSKIYIYIYILVSEDRKAL